MPALASFYDHSSLVSSLTYGNGSTKSYVYDDQQRIKQTYVDNTLTSLYNYDRLGNLVKYSDAKIGLTWSHEYDLIGRATRSDASDGRYIGYNYDSFNRLYTVKENVRGYELKTVYDYDDQCNYSEKSGLVTGLTMNNCRQFVYSYDKLNRLTSKTLLKSYGVKTTYSYLEGAGENTTTALIKSINNDGELLEYAYDQNGNITSIKKNGALLESYEYDALNQLTKVTRGSEVYTYAYDNAGNILSVKKNGTAIKTYGYSDPEWKDLLTSFNGQTITYDAIGNPLTYRDGMTMTWQSGRQLASINKDGLSATFAYDANGHRTQKTVNGVTTNYYWVGDRLQYMAIGDDMYVFFYDDKGTPYGVFTLIDGVQEHLFYLYNAQGDVIAIIDDYAERVVNYEYSAWGELLSVTGSKADTVGVINPFRYRGYCYDTETGLYYLNSRYYDPITQRFLNGDGYVSTGQGVLGNNMFAYCGNNPMNNYDPYGEFALSATACGLIFALASTLTAIVLVDSIAKNPPVLPPISLPRSKGNDVTQPLPPLPKYLERSDDSANAAPKVKVKEKDITLPLPPGTIIYRYGGTNPGNLTPREKDKYSGLSFSTKPMPGAAMTTIEQLNATGIVYAVQDGPTHVSVRPVGATMEDWINAGSGSIWTQAVKSVVIKWDGDY